MSSIEKEYSKLPEDKAKIRESKLRTIDEKERKLNEFIDQKLNSETTNKSSNFSNFTIKGSLLRMLCSFLVNKKTIIVSLSLFVIILINRYFRSQVNNLFTKIENITFIKKTLVFMKGLLYLLVNS